MKKLLIAIVAVVSMSAHASYDSKWTASVHSYCSAYSNIVLTIYDLRNAGWNKGAVILKLKQHNMYNDVAQLAVNAAYSMRGGMPGWRVKVEAKRECVTGLTNAMVK